MELYILDGRTECCQFPVLGCESSIKLWQLTNGGLELAFLFVSVESGDFCKGCSVSYDLV